VSRLLIQAERYSHVNIRCNKLYLHVMDSSYDTKACTGTGEVTQRWTYEG
jgi:hypothetical protein